MKRRTLARSAPLLVLVTCLLACGEKRASPTARVAEIIEKACACRDAACFQPLEAEIQRRASELDPAAQREAVAKATECRRRNIGYDCADLVCTQGHHCETVAGKAQCIEDTAHP